MKDKLYKVIDKQGYINPNLYDKLEDAQAYLVFARNTLKRRYKCRMARDKMRLRVYTETYSPLDHWIKHRYIIRDFNIIEEEI